MKWEDIPIDRLSKDNSLGNDETFNMGNTHSWWGSEQGNKFRYDPIKDNQVNSFPNATFKNGQYKIGDGRHRVKALQNAGYTHVNMPVFESQNLYPEDAPKEPTEQEYMEKAVQTFGTTPNFKRASYMLPDGSMLDGSPFNDPRYGRRTEDHGYIGEIFSDNYSGGHEYMYKFMDMGGIRLKPEINGLEIGNKRPTQEQIREIVRLVRNGDISTLEINKNQGRFASENPYVEDVYTPLQVVDFINENFPQK